jgi:hypothetical protein
MIVKPAEKWFEIYAIVESVTPAGTITHTARGPGRRFAKSAIEGAAVKNSGFSAAKLEATAPSTS